jgi:hypothetical protein
MNILKTHYNGYVEMMQQAKTRMKRDKQIVKLVSKMINTKNLSISEQKKLDNLLKFEG